MCLSQSFKQTKSFNIKLHPKTFNIKLLPKTFDIKIQNKLNRVRWRCSKTSCSRAIKIKSSGNSMFNQQSPRKLSEDKRRITESRI